MSVSMLQLLAHKSSVHELSVVFLPIKPLTTFIYPFSESVDGCHLLDSVFTWDSLDQAEKSAEDHHCGNVAALGV